MDDLTDVAVNEKGQSLDGTYVVFDLETTGFQPDPGQDHRDRCGKGRKWKDHRQIQHIRQSQACRFPLRSQDLPASHDEMVMDAPAIEDSPSRVSGVYAEMPSLVAHNASFDVGFIEQNMRLSGSDAGLYYLWIPWRWHGCSFRPFPSYKLNVVAKALNISLENHHRAVDDAGATAEIFVKFVEMLKEQGSL